MADTLSREHRSWNMSRIRHTDTRPEKTLRSLLHRLGFRFSLRNRSLPGRPDLVLARYKTAVFVHGCFWHRHPRCRLSYTPKSNRSFWLSKFESNVQRDRDVRRLLKKAGWNIVTVWECQLRRDPTAAALRVASRLRTGRLTTRRLP